MSPRPLIFLHVPKSSGIAVSHALLQAEKPPRVFFGFDRAFFGGFADFDSVPAENRAFIHMSPETIPADETFVRAHMALSTLRAAFPRGRFMTVFREPVCRVLSHFVFWRGFSTAQDAGWGGWAARSGLARGTLAAFLEAPDVSCQIDNVATRLLLWPHRLIPDDGPIADENDTELLAEARDRIRGLDYVDVVENPDFYSALGSWLGTALAPARLNETVALPAALYARLDAELTARATAALAARCRLDLALWRYVLELKLPGVDVDALRLAAIQRGVARASRLLAGGAKAQPSLAEEPTA